MQPTEIIETYDDQGRYTGHYRLVGVPGGALELPGKGGLVTRRAAERALEVLRQGGTHDEAQEAAYASSGLERWSNMSVVATMLLHGVVCTFLILGILGGLLLGLAGVVLAPLLPFLPRRWLPLLRLWR